MNQKTKDILQIQENIKEYGSSYENELAPYYSEKEIENIKLFRYISPFQKVKNLFKKLNFEAVTGFLIILIVSAIIFFGTYAVLNPVDKKTEEIVNKNNQVLEDFKELKRMSDEYEDKLGINQKERR
jgi:hypothetical protein